ncbi:MAG: YolD-like family protein [Epulopiscium sp.]|nr:YolD-like family protein [Candidatus Epulonipiscium sp.]
MNDDLNDVNRYDDIINLPHHESKTHPRMSKLNRAAQFSPFAALTGYDMAIKEAARLTYKRIELDETEKSVLDEKMRIIQDTLSSKPEITITYFQPDEKKLGGAYLSITGIVKKIDGYNRSILMQDGTRIGIEDIISITGEIVQSIDDYIIT